MKPDYTLMKHSFYVVLLRSGLLLAGKAGPLGTSKLVDAALFDTKAKAADHVKWMKAVSCDWVDELKGCRYKPVHARLEIS